MMTTDVVFEQPITDNSAVVAIKRIYIPPQLIPFSDMAIQTGMPDQLVESSNGISFAGS